MTETSMPEVRPGRSTFRAPGIVLSLVLLLACAPDAPAQTPNEGRALQTQEEGDAGFAARRRILLDTAAVQSETSFYAAMARLETGHDTAGAFRMIDSLCHDKSMGGMFYAYTLISTYLYGQEKLPPVLKEKIREAYRTRTMYRGDTENHWLAYYTGIYLAAQTWPGEEGSRWFNGRSSEENLREAGEYISRWMNITATIGQGEFDSPTYITVFLAPLTALQNFARDPVMKRKAQMTLDLLLADFAVEHLKGYYGGAHSRDYPEDACNPISAPSTLWGWLYFGEPETLPWAEARYRPRNQGSWESVLAALSSYRLPEVIRQIANDRSRPYVSLETKRVRNVIRYSDSLNPPVYKYTYMTPDYVLGSIQGGILQPIQQHTWDVTFVSGKPNNTIFTLHPYASGSELAMFFPEEPRFLTDEVDRYHKVYTSPEKWISSSPFERVFQHRNALIALYNIPEGTRQSHIDGFFPKSLDERTADSTGWIFCKGGKTYVAFRPLRSFAWIEEKAAWRWRSGDLKNGVIVEVGSEAEHGSFPAFRQAVRSKARVSAGDLERELTVQYRTTGGDLMRFTFDGARQLNGKRVEFSRGMLYDSPFISSRYRSGIITFKHGGRTRTLDFNRATITDR